MADKKGTPLTGIAGFPEEIAGRLSGLWITTAEELVSAAVREGGPAGLAEFLNVPVDELSGYIDIAQGALPPNVSFDAGDIQPFGMGALDEPSDEEPPGAMLSFAPLPPKVDLLAGMPPVRNQGQRGTCVSFACTAVREYLLGSNPEQGDLSEQYLYWACKQVDGWNGPGTYISVGMDRLLNEGECVEVDWPYNPAPITGNEGHHPPPPDASTKAAAYRISETQTLPARSVQHLRQALSEGLPVAFAVPVFTYWFTEPVRRTGDIRLPLNTDYREGGHAMCLVGYEDDPAVPGGGYFMVRNSWGVDWACENSLLPGHARLPYAYIEQYATAAHTAKVAPQPKPAPQKPKGMFDRLIDWWKRMFG